MMELNLALDLTLRPNFVPKTVTEFLCHLSATEKNATLKLSLLDDFLSKLELELSKLQPFKRQLPLSIFLLNDAISALKVESANCRAQRCEPVMEEFIPLKKECDQREESEKNEKDNKKNWMSSVQLWNWNTNNCNNNNNAYEYDKKQNYKLENKNYEEERQGVVQYGRNRNGRRAFVMPFSMYHATKEKNEDCVVNGLSLQTPGTVMKNSKVGSGSRTTSGRVVSSSDSGRLQQRITRKQRRCWSPELHHRFIKALEELGGSQVAMPKQIREIMRVDGLTNDEVKSHLQKYRLHTRRVPPAPVATANRSLEILGGLWMHNESSKSSSSDSPQGPLQLATRSGEGTSPAEGDIMIDDNVKSEL